MDNAQKAIMIGVGLFITIIIISAVLLIVNLGTGLVDESTAKLDSISSSLQGRLTEEYDNKIMTGSRVLSTIREFENSTSLCIGVFGPISENGFCTAIAHTGAKPISVVDGNIGRERVVVYEGDMVADLAATPEPTPVVTAAPTAATAAATVTPAPTTSATVAPTSTTKPPKKVTIKFKKKSVKIKKGKKVTLKVTLKNAKKANFSVDKKGKKVVKLSKKKAKSVVVTGKKKGKATITAKAGKKKATCKVTVK